MPASLLSAARAGRRRRPISITSWANVYVDEPVVPRLRLGQPATVFTDAGGAGLPGTVSYIASKAEFTPRNVQTAEDRSKLVYRVEDRRRQHAAACSKAGMPVEAEIPFSNAHRRNADMADCIALDRVGKRYGETDGACASCRCRSSRGEMFGLIGPDGAGKTTDDPADLRAAAAPTPAACACSASIRCATTGG